MVNVTFNITFDYKRFYSEDEILEPEAELAARIEKANTIEGAIVIGNTGTQNIEIVDELAPWIQNLCFKAVSATAYGGTFHIDYFSRSGFVDITSEEKVITLSGNLTGSAEYPRMELLRALVSCGRRFIDIMGHLKRNDANYMENISYIAQFEEAASLSIAETGI